MIKDVHDLLPVGSVVLLHNGTDRVIINGYLPYNAEDDTTYDYLGQPYPVGQITEFVAEFNLYKNTNDLVFNHENIQSIIFKGYNDSEREDMLNKLSEQL